MHSCYDLDAWRPWAGRAVPWRAWLARDCPDWDVLGVTMTRAVRPLGQFDAALSPTPELHCLRGNTHCIHAQPAHKYINVAIWMRGGRGRAGRHRGGQWGGLTLGVCPVGCVGHLAVTHYPLTHSPQAVPLPTPSRRAYMSSELRLGKLDSSIQGTRGSSPQVLIRDTLACTHTTSEEVT